ncbi:MAG TPA: serpin family protein [Prolixibacteraceae bacterium]|nr:serpin family protein [Prolixibacteraceae bacterium]HPS12862.1 serpin family protein [Prolixibacteraceae bacterium]
MKRLSFILLLIVALFSCNKDDSTVKDLGISEKSEKLINANNEFGLDLFTRVYNAPKTPVNFMISPFSVAVALSMAYNGAETETKIEMEEAMQIPDFSRDDINNSYKQLITALTTADDKVIMEVANSIWYSNTYPVQQSFLDVNTTYYNAEVEAANFSDANTVNQINNWVSDKTHEKITQIITDISPEMVMYLINAIYFKGTWTKEFNTESTQLLPFKAENGNYQVTAMMGRRDTLNYFSNGTFSAIELPYGQGNYNMMVLLPNEDKTVADIIGQLNSSNWAKWQKAFKKTNSIDIRFPRFKIEYDIKLNDILMSMGMEQAFTSSADFSGINPARDLFISYVKHKTYIDVNEEGTEAAAVTVIGFENTSANEPQWIPFHCYNPFLFAITEKDSGAILFMGKVGNPAKK